MTTAVVENHSGGNCIFLRDSQKLKRKTLFKNNLYL